MLSRALVSDEALLGHAIFISMAAVALLIFLGLGMFAWNEAALRPAEKSESPSVVAGKKERPPYPTTISLFADGAMMISTKPSDTNKSFPREEVGLVLAEMRLRKAPPPLIIRCDPGVQQAMLMEVLVKARETGLHDIRLVVPREEEKP
jgi:biopolymer transport protein ExbD